MLFYEIRLLISISIIILFLEKSRILDSLLKIFLQWYIGYLFHLPIRINTCYINLYNGIFQMSGFQILVPDKSIDNRWYHECILEISFIDIKFCLFNSLISFILTFGYLVYVKNITIDSMKIFIEGYEDPVTGDFSINMDLIGKTDKIVTNETKDKVASSSKKKKNRTWVSNKKSSEWELVNNSITKSKVAATPNVTATATATATTATATVVVNARPIKATELNQTISSPLSPSSPSSMNIGQSSSSSSMFNQKEGSLFSNFSGIVGNFIKEVDNSGGLELYVQKKSETFTKSLTDGSLLQNAKKTIDDAFSTAKRKIDEGVNSKIISAHEYLRGGEPTASQDDLRILGRYLILRDVQVNVRSVLPVTLRHLERKTLSAKYIRLPLHKPEEITYSNCTPEASGKDNTLNIKKTSSSNLFETWTTVQSFDDEQDKQYHDDDIFIPLDIKSGVHSAILQHRFEKTLLIQIIKNQSGSLLFEAIDWDILGSNDNDNDPRLVPKAMRSENPFFVDDDDD